ncbi:DNA polymerase delta subunit 2-like [Venturia canescens]|uniref:DNA polymerase delta subunit 2-like n=1 Tax=Venturia canescens TaxID=32260 RepID=UPI001C9D56C1|nr:DNA polymerase delta subunit 2-like [Venturia canescens]
MIDLQEAESLSLERQNIVINDFGRFKIGTKNYHKQFCGIYIARLAALKDSIVATAKIKWGQYPILSVDRLTEFNDQKTFIVIGTLYKHQELKPSILKELSQELQVPYQPQRSNYTSDKDKLFLENELIRAKLLGNHPNPKAVVTGLICAVLGHETDDGAFWVDDWCFPGCCPCISGSGVPTQNEGKLLIVSGFDFANTPDNLSLELLREWISGFVGDSSAQKEGASVVQMLVAGNSVRSKVETYTRYDFESKKSHTDPVALESILATHRFDSYLSGIAENCPIILMPGQFDPSEHSLPQQPLHPCILPKSSRYKTVRGATNPWIGKIANRIVSGSSGQPINDITRVGGLEESTALEWLEKTLIWRHFAPTAPDTLPVYPYFGTDPFVMIECPDIYFAGNMEEFATKMYIGEEGQTVRLICVPKFAKTGTAVLVDLNSLDTWPISFGSG